MISSKRSMVVGVFVACSSVLGCSLASPTYITSTQDSPIDEESEGGSTSPSSAAPASGGTPVTCNSSDYAKPDLSKLTACGPGNKGGHCFPKAKSPMADQLVACATATDVCVPDAIILAAGKPLKTCTSGIGAGGGCIATGFLPTLDTQSAGFLKQDVCSAGEICAPCTDPTHNGAATPFCQPIGVHDAECSASGGATGGADAGPPPAPLVGCCTTGAVSNGVCLAESAIPEEQRSQTKADTCTSGNKCVPKAMVEGKPVTCNSILGAGVCMDKCFNDMMKMAGGIGILSKASCGATELCIPCSLASAGGTKVPGCQ